VTPAARYAAAISVLDRWLDGAPMEQALTGWARSARYAGSKDRAAVRDHVFDALRQRGSCEAFGNAGDGRGLVLGLIRGQGLDPEAVFTGEGYAPAPLSADEAVVPAVSPDPLRDLPEWLRPALSAALGPDLSDVASALEHRAPMWLRANLRKNTREQSLEALRADGLAVEPTALCDTAIMVVSGGRQLRQTQAYLSGMVEPQDLSVQMAIARVNWPATGRILDYCAGGGGKTLAIGAVSGATLVAHDANPGRMADLFARAERAGVQVTTAATTELNARGPWDVVLCDVPCSGSGTWRRDPEAKWRLTPEALADLNSTQDTILAAAANLVSQRGRLIYMTCSLLPIENMDRITAFLAQSPDWSCTWYHQDTPLTASDGFFTAELVREAAPS